MALTPTGYWLLKSEPDVFSFATLAARLPGTAPWDGVRNYQARNFIRDTMRVGQLFLFYHSSCAVPGVVGLGEIASAPQPDPTQWEATHPGYDATAPRDPARWWLVEVRAVAEFPRPVTLAELRADPAVADLLVLQRGQRLSVQPVQPTHFRYLLEKGGLAQEAARIVG